MYGEARGEILEGQVGVGCCLRNRFSTNPAKYINYHSVCLEPAQFTCWNEADPNRSVLDDLARKIVNGIPISDPIARQCIFLARGIVDWLVKDNIQNNRYYMRTDLLNSSDCPKWANSARRKVVIGHHTFFTV